MILKRIFSRLFSKAKSSTDPGTMVSIVLLLREPKTYEDWELAAAIGRAWGPSEGHHAVVQGPLGFLKIESNFVQVICGKRPYFDSRTSRKIQPAWAQHQAFVAVDHMDSNPDLKLRYAVVAKLVTALLNKNCVAVYSPGVGGFVPNDDSLSERLRTMAASCDAAS